MKDEDFYFEETSPKNVKIACIIIVIVLILGIIAFIYARKTVSFNIKNGIEVELGSKISKDVEFYVSNKVIDEDDYTLIFNDVSLDADGKFDMIGEYTFRVKYKSITKKGILNVVDTTPPEVEVMDYKIGVDETLEPESFIASCSDYSMPCNVEIKNKVETNKAGTFEVELVISDQYKNKVTKKAKLIVEKGYKQEDIKRNDLNIVSFSEDFNDFDNKYIIKYKKAMNISELQADEEFQDLVEKATSEYNALYIYVPIEYQLNKVIDFNMIEAYNRYGYVVAIALRVKLDNGKILYLTK